MLTHYKYLYFGLLKPFIVILCVLSAVICATQAVRFIEIVLNYGEGFGYILQLLLYLMPTLWFNVFPFACFLATLYILHKLHVNCEILAMYNFGLSDRSIAKPFITLSIIVTIVHYIISLYLMPYTHKHFKIMQNSLYQHCALTLVDEGNFMTKMPKLTIYVDKRIDNRGVQGIFIYDARSQDKKIIVSANYAKINSGTHGILNIALQDGTYQEEISSNHRNYTAFFKNYNIALNLKNSSMEQASNAIMDVNEYSIAELLSASQNAGDNNQYIAALHQRFVWPLYCLLLTILATFMFLKYANHVRYTRNYHVILIGVTGTLINIWGFLLQNLALKNSYFIVLMYVTITLYLLILGFGFRLRCGGKHLICGCCI
ncbi:lipopolysaccharide export system permease protein [Alphaproteobacteria bacterium]